MPGDQLLRDSDAYAVHSVAAKGLDDSQQAEAVKGIRCALRRLYRALAVDVDGTLTVEGDAALDAEVAAVLRRLLSRGVPVILVTGRGRSASEVMDSLAARRRDQSPGRLHCVIRNGAAVLEPAVEGSGDRYTIRTLGVPIGLDAVSAIDQLSNSPDRARYARAADDETSPIHAARLEYADATIRDAAMAELAPLAALGLNVTKAQYQDIKTINITAITKNEGLEVLARELGLEPEEVLRIGDQGGPGGNDADLLDSVVGFSVGETSAAPGRCHPVVTESGDVLTGAQATGVLVAGVTLSPPIKRTAATVDDETIRRFGLVEQRARAGAAAALEQLSSQMNRSFAALVGDGGGLAGPPSLAMSDVFDPLSGAVRLRDYEIDTLLREMPTGHPAREMFGFDGVFNLPPSRPFLMASDSGVLLRGGYYYSGLVQERSAERVRTFLETTQSLLAEGIEVINVLAHEPPSLARLKVVLGIADHARNALLQTSYIAWKAASSEDDFVLLGPIVEAAVEHLRSHLRLIFENEDLWESALGAYAADLGVVQDTVAGLLSGPLAHVNELDFAKALVRERECDHFAINVAAMRLGLDGHRGRMALPRGAHIVCYGLPYGGIELPLLAHVLGDGLDLAVSAGFLHASTYEDEVLGDHLRRSRTRTLDELRERPLMWRLGESFDDETVLLADDNTTTAVTLQYAIDVLAADGTDAAGAIMVQYPTTNRREHMRLPGHGCIEPDTLLGFVRGLIQPTPYTRLLRAGEGEDKYRDRQGVFNKSKKRIENLLAKAGLAVEHEPSSRTTMEGAPEGLPPDPREPAK